MNFDVVFCSCIPAQHGEVCCSVQKASAEQPNASAQVAIVQHEQLDFDDIPDTLPSRRDVESGLIREDEVSAAGWCS